MNEVLNLTPEDKISEWSEIIKANLANNIDVYIVGDTETTGVNDLGDKNNFGRKDRILEVGFLCFVESKDKTLKPLTDLSGTQIFFHEYVNPFEEDSGSLERYNSITYIPDEVINHVHGIDLEFLRGNKGLVMRGGGRDKTLLSKPAPTFSVIKPYIETLFDLINLFKYKGKLNFVAHNALFDVSFMNAEWLKSEMFDEKRRMPTPFEAYISSKDTLTLMQKLYTRKELTASSQLKNITAKVGFGLDFLQTFYDIKIERDMHGALLDAKILAALYNEIIRDPRYQNSNVIMQSKDIGYTRVSHSVVGLSVIKPKSDK